MTDATMPPRRCAHGVVMSSVCLACLPHGDEPGTELAAIPSRGDRPDVVRLDRAPPCSGAIDHAASAVRAAEELAAFVGRSDDLGAARAAERTIQAIDETLGAFGIELGEVLPRRRCADCRSEVVDFRLLPSSSDPHRHEPVCVSCSIARTDARRERERREAAPRASVLERAAAIVRDRQPTYGDPGAAFARVARLWAPILGTEVTPAKVALCMIQLKVARLAETPTHTDSWDDVAGYADCGDRATRGTA